MTARKCFTGKMESGRVNRAAFDRISRTIDEFEATHKKSLGDAEAIRKAAEDAVTETEKEAARKADLANGQALAQLEILRVFSSYDGVVQKLAQEKGALGIGTKAPLTIRGQLGGDRSALYAAVSSKLAPDRHEIATWDNAYAAARNIRAEAQKIMADAGALEDLRPKKLGLADESARELETLRAAFNQAADPQAIANWQGFHKAEGLLADYFIAARGAIAKLENYFPNPVQDRAKVQAIGFERFKALHALHDDRARMIDVATGRPMTDARYDELVKQTYDSIFEGSAEGLPTAAATARKQLANSRTVHRLFQYKSAESWMAIAEATGTHASPMQAMMSHIASMAEDIAMLRNFGPNPEGTKRFIHALFDRESARLSATALPGATPAEIANAAKLNKRIDADVRAGRKRFDDLWAEVTGANDIPVNTTLATRLGDMRSWLVAAQMGSAIVSSISDTGLVTMTARFNGLPATRVLSRAVSMMGEKGSEIFAAQQGVIADTLIHAAGKADRISGETIRIGLASKISTAVVRASGLRRWSAVLKAAFSLEFMAHGARELGKDFVELDPQFREALSRVAIGEGEWKILQKTEPHSPRPGAPFLRAEDIRGIDDPRAAELADRWARLINTEMDYAVIDQDPRVRAIWLGESQPGTKEGELRRAVGMYKMFPSAIIALHMARAFARGFDGTRLAYGGLTFISLAMFGALSMQAKDVLAGREPRSLDPRSPHGFSSWGAAILQGGGLGIFGDLIAVDQTRYGNTWAATLAGPQLGAVEAVLGDFLMKNARKALKGEETQFAGDALYVAGRYMPGSSLWMTRLAFQRAILDQLALIIDPKAPERFARIEQKAREDWGQRMLWRPGNALPEFAR
jgi:hypothetical protein